MNNLKSIDVEIPRGKLVVITGLSGSGKSSLAFDTLYAEGQRRYVESLSSYARQFLGKMAKPECDFIKGLPPAIAIEQKVTTRNSRSTVGTSTEIYDYLRMLFARVGKTFSPISGNQVKKHTSNDVLSAINSYPIGTRIALLSQLHIPADRDFATHLSILLKGGYSRLEHDTRFVNITDILPDANNLNPAEYRLLIDRLAVTRTKEDDMRLLDSLSTAFFEGQDECVVMVWQTNGTVQTLNFSKRFEADGMTFEEPSDLMFNFNNPVGACPVCEGFGKVTGIDENLVVPNKALSVYDDAVACWRGKIIGEWKDQFIRQAVPLHFPIHTPYNKLTDEQRQLLWHGNSHVTGIDEFFRFVQSKSYSIQYRVMLARYRGKTVCPECNGSRLKKGAQYVRIGGCTIADLVKMPVSQLLQWFENLQLDATDALVAKRLTVEITNRLRFLNEVGLGYLTLDRVSSTLSGGESQRISLTTSLGSSLVGSVYILDEPSIGLHQRDNDRLIKSLKELRDLDNTVIVVEHDKDMMLNADYVVDIGPKAGRRGGEVVFQGTPQEMLKQHTITSQYLNGEKQIEIPAQRRQGNGKQIKITGARGNNLKNVTVEFPLGKLIVVTGVSGSGKSTLINETLQPILSQHFYRSLKKPMPYDSVEGLEYIDKVVNVDQSPLGRTPRSNPATYTGVFSDIRSLFVNLPEAKIRGYKPGRFSFNVKGGRCETCGGNGYKTIEMRFLPDIMVPCETCRGKRYNRETLEVRYKGKSISDVLDMTINQAVEFFENVPDILRKIKTIQDVGLGYIKLGQPSTTLSGGESQRVKLATELSKRDTGKTMYILDEPTTGLHFEDIRILMDVLQKLVDRGNTVVIIEHNLDVIKLADHLIDMGPEGGRNGGTVLSVGTPEQVAASDKGFTPKFLREALGIQ